MNEVTKKKICLISNLYLVELVRNQELEYLAVIMGKMQASCIMANHTKYNSLESTQLKEYVGCYDDSTVH